MRPQTPSSYQNQPGWPSLDLRDGLDDWEPSRSRCGGDVAPVSVPYALHLRQLCDTRGGGAEEQVFFWSCTWRFQGDSSLEVPRQEIVGGDSGGRRWCRRCRNQPSNSELRAHSILASPPFTARVREFALLFLAPPPPTHALETTNSFFGSFFFFCGCLV